MNTSSQTPGAPLSRRPRGFSLVRQGGRRGVRAPGTVALPSDRLRIMSFNMQAAIGTSRFSEYITGSWKHLVASPRSLQTLEGIGEVVRSYDLVALQEVDGGSLRSRFLNQLSHLATAADFPFWHQQLNRDFGRFGQFSNGLLSRWVPFAVEDHQLPGLPGRGAFIAKFGHPDEPLVVVGVHLALGTRYRNAQLYYLAQLLRQHRHLVILGDFNCLPDDLMRSPITELDLQLMPSPNPTYPSWAPEKHLDHILISPTLEAVQPEVLSDCHLSDHLPVATELLLPPSVREAAALAAVEREG